MRGPAKCFEAPLNANQRRTTVQSGRLVACQMGIGNRMVDAMPPDRKCRVCVDSVARYYVVLIGFGRALVASGAKMSLQYCVKGLAVHVL